MADKFQQIAAENNKLHSLVGELRQRVVDVELKQKSINSILNLVQSGKVSVKAEKESDVGLSIKKMAEPIYDWLKKEPVKLDLV